MSIVEHIVSNEHAQRICSGGIESYSCFYWNNDGQLRFGNQAKRGSGIYPAYLASELIYILHGLRVGIIIENGTMDGNNVLFHRVKYDIMQGHEVAELMGKNLCHILSSIVLRYLELKKGLDGSIPDKSGSEEGSKEEV